MIESKQAIAMKTSRGGVATHANSGKLRIAVFDIEVNKSEDTFVLTRLSAGFSRVLPELCSFTFVGEKEGMTFSLGNGIHKTGRVKTATDFESIIKDGNPSETPKGVSPAGSVFNSTTEMPIVLKTSKKMPSESSIHGYIVYVQD